MKTGDLVILDEHPTPLCERLLHHLGVIVATSPVFVDGLLVAWTNGRKDWMKPRWVKPYEGYAGKKHNDIK